MEDISELRFGHAALITCEDLYRRLGDLMVDLDKNFHVICLLLDDPRSDVVDDFLKVGATHLTTLLDHAMKDEHDMVCFGRLLEHVPALRDALPENTRPAVDRIIEVRCRALAGSPRP